VERHEPINWLRSKGFKAYLVGNQVRAILLKQEDYPRDVDIATEAHPQEILRIVRSKRIVPTFIDSKFGVVSFVTEGFDFSLTTFREDIYSAKELSRFKRYPHQVRFVRSLKKDALRRDITINAIYFDPQKEHFLDPLGGLKDFQGKIIRVVGDPKMRFEEDPLRILRVVRFKNLLNFRYQAETQKALQLKGYLARSLSASVRSKELRKIQELPRAQEALKELREFQVVESGL